MFNGFKTFTVGFLLALVPQVVEFLSESDLVEAFGLSPDAATFIGILMIGLRVMTSTPIFKKS